MAKEQPKFLDNFKKKAEIYASDKTRASFLVRKALQKANEQKNNLIKIWGDLTNLFRLMLPGHQLPWPAAPGDGRPGTGRRSRPGRHRPGPGRVRQFPPLQASLPSLVLAFSLPNGPLHPNYSKVRLLALLCFVIMAAMIFVSAT